MQPIYGNFKCDISKPRLCQHCSESDDTTEHLLSCRALGINLDEEFLCNDDHMELWRQINEAVDYNLNHRLEGCI